MGNALSRPINESFKYRYARIPPYGERKGHPCSPAQRSLDDIPVICFDVSKKRRTRRFIRFIRARIRRAQKWSHERYYGKSVTPMWNPSNPKINYTKEEMAKNPKLKGKNPNTGYGYHIVELTNKRKNSNKVQLLFNDFNKYLSAFRSFKDGKWSRWYRCSDTEIPDYFDAINMGVDGCHGAEKSTIGGDETLDDIFNTLWSFPYKETRKGDLKRALMRAVVVFSETLRLILVYHIVVRRMQFNSKSFPLPAIAWDQITSWGNLGEFALETGCENKGYVNYCKFNSFVRPHGIVDFEHLIVHRRSVVMVIQWKGEQLLPCGWKESNHKLLVGKPGRPGGNRVLEDVDTSFVPSPPVSPYETHNARRAARVARREAQRQSDKQLYAYTRPPRTAPNERYDTSEAKREARIARKAARREEERRIREDITRTIRYGEFGEIGEEFLQGLLDTIELELAAAAAGHLYNPIPNQELGQD